ncbi:MAG: T9SS type A sorting domain-containing protein [Ignavibacteriales bacterium]|nr:T9SS type A sorting domain-containing protein [Ignavibacteriales bacterium]
MKYLSLLVFFSSQLFSQTLNLPARPTSSPTGSQFYSIIASLSRQAREDTIFKHVVAGNIPNFLRNLDTITVSKTISSTLYTLEYYVTPDYLAIGSDDDYFLMPMTPILAQKIVNYLDCTLPTKQMVDQIYSKAQVKLRPQPIPPDADMDKAPRFWQHNDSVKALRAPLLGTYPLGSLVGGTKKDVIIDKKVYSWLKSSVPKPVVIYGWHQLNGSPIQPTYNGHGETYADYSHGVRLVQRMAQINGAEISLLDIVQDPTYFSLIADTILMKPYYGSLTSADEEIGMVPTNDELFQNYPNPFNPTTNISFTIQVSGFTSLKIYDMIGKEIYTLLNEKLEPGEYRCRFSAAQLPSGIYFYRLTTPTFSQTNKMAFIK